MRTTTRRPFRGRVALLLAASSILAVACGSDDDTSSSRSSATDVDAADSTGSQASTGSSAPRTSAADAGSPTSGGVLRLAWSTDPTSLDPSSGSSGNDYMELYPLYDTLITFTPDLVPQPGLASEWEWVEETRLRLTLVEGVTFHDGTPFDADAVKVNIEHFKRDMSNWKGDLASIDAVEVVSPNVVDIVFSAPDASIIMKLADRAGMMMSPTSLAEQGEDYSSPVGTGPFTFVEFIPGTRVVFQKNPEYWREGLPYLDGIEIQIMADDQAKVNALKSGQVDFLPAIGPTAIPDLEAAGMVVDTRTSLGFDMCYINKNEPPLDDVRVRQALNYATDRDALNQALNGDISEPAWMPWPSSHWAYQEDLVPTYPYDPEKARALLEEAGYGDGLSISGLLNPGARQSMKNEILQAQWAEIGVALSLEVMDTAAASPAYFERQNYDVFCSSASGRVDPTVALQQIYGADSYLNVGATEYPGLTEAIAATQTSADEEARDEAIHEAARLASESAMIVPIVFLPAVDAYVDRMHGFEQTLLGRARLTSVWLES